MHKQLKRPPPLRVEPVRFKAQKKPKDISFSEALNRLKRGFKVKRAQWNNFYLEIIEDDRGEKTIYNKTSSNNQNVRHSFDQSEILANDWMVL